MERSQFFVELSINIVNVAGSCLFAEFFESWCVSKKGPTAEVVVVKLRESGPEAAKTGSPGHIMSFDLVVDALESSLAKGKTEDVSFFTGVKGLGVLLCCKQSWHTTTLQGP